MAILFISTINNFNTWEKELHTLSPNLDIRTLDTLGNPDDITTILAWKPPAGIFPLFRNLKLIQSLGMGVDHLLNCPDLPKNVPIARIVDHDMPMQMAEYVLYGVLHHHRQFQAYKAQQMNAIWKPLSMPKPKGCRVGIMGFGELGKAVAKQIHLQGFPISTWSNTPKSHPNYQMFHGIAEQKQFLQTADILVNLLPLTALTRHIIDAKLLSLLPKGAFLINAARGEHLVEDDLLNALNTGQISGALLDVCQEEPLPKTHPFWQHSKLILTPHVAACTNPNTASLQIIHNHTLISSGKNPEHQIELARQY